MIIIGRSQPEQCFLLTQHTLAASLACCTGEATQQAQVQELQTQLAALKAELVDAKDDFELTVRTLPHQNRPVMFASGGEVIRPCTCTKCHTPREPVQCSHRAANRTCVRSVALAYIISCWNVLWGQSVASRHLLLTKLPSCMHRCRSPKIWCLCTQHPLLVSSACDAAGTGPP